MADPRATLEDLLDDPAVSYPLKAVLLVWFGRDPVDAANDAALLSDFMAARAPTALERRHGP
jgi:hypothetical protein